MEKYLVTGAAGHLGLNIVNELCLLGENVKVLVLPNDKNVCKLPENVEVCYGDIRNKSDLDNFFKNPDNDDLIVIHAAGIVSIGSKYNSLVYDVNVNGTKNVVDECVKNNVKKMLYVSSVHAIKEKPNHEIITETTCFNPDDVEGLYAKTKAEATAYVLDAASKGLNATVVHPSGILGPNDYGKGHITQMVIDFCNGTLTAGVQGGYDFVDARDVSKGIVTATEKGKKGECYILSNKYFEVKTLLDLLAKITKKKEIKTYLPMWFAKLTAPIAEKYYEIRKEPPLYTSYSLFTLDSNSNFSHEKATRELDYKPREFEETIDDTASFLRKEKRIRFLK